jgi:alanine dehydrogenase
MPANAMANAGDGTLVLTRSDVVRLLDARSCIDAVEAAFRARGEGRPSPSGVLGIHLPEGGLHAKGAALDLRRAFAVVKVNANFPANPARHGLPTIQGVLALFDADTGRVLALMDSMSITNLRTAAASAVAANYLSDSSAGSVAIVGCGAQALPHAVAIAAVRPITRIVAYDSRPAAAERFCAAARAALGLEAVVAAELDEATTACPIVVTLTPSEDGYLFRHHLQTGAFVAAVGADSEHKQEMTSGLMATAAVIVDDADQCAAIGDLHHAIVEGAMQRSHVRATLADIVVNPSRGRRSADEIVIFDSTGVAIEDVAAAAITYERALADGSGQRIHLDA